MELLMAMRDLSPNSVIDYVKEVPVVDRAISCYRLKAFYGKGKVAKKDFAVWSMISIPLMIDADKRVFFNTKSLEADWGRATFLYRA